MLMTMGVMIMMIVKSVIMITMTRRMIMIIVISRA